jgi:hypothetical protein
MWSFKSAFRQAHQNAAQPNWQNIYPKDDVPCCKNVGKNAHNNSTNTPLLRGIKLRKI